MGLALGVPRYEKAGDGCWAGEKEHAQRNQEHRADQPCGQLRKYERQRNKCQQYIVSKFHD